MRARERTNELRPSRGWSCLQAPAQTWGDQTDTVDPEEIVSQTSELDERDATKSSQNLRTGDATSEPGRTRFSHRRLSVPAVGPLAAFIHNGATISPVCPILSKPS